MLKEIGLLFVEGMGLTYEDLTQYTYEQLMQFTYGQLGTYLQSQGIGTLGDDIFLGLMPDKPDNCIALFEYAGSPPDLHWNGEYPGLQVRVRNKSYAAARTKIGEVAKKLHGLHEQTLFGTRYLLIKARGSPEVLKRDANNRVELFVNFEIIKESD